MSGKGFSKIYSQPSVQVILLVGFCFFLYFLNLGRWDLWNPDEPRYAQVAREMVQGGDWILMHFNGKTYADKPPLFFWLIAFSSFLWQGFSSFSVRFPAAFFGTLTVLLTFFLGRILYSSRAGFLSGFVLATSFEFAYLSTRANIDTTLTFFTTGSLLCFFLLNQYRKEENLSQWPLKNLVIYGFYVGIALATLTKGPVGFILPLSIGFIYLAIQKDWKGIQRMQLLTGMSLFLIILFAWYLPALLKGGEDYLNATLFHHTIDRYSKGLSHVKPIYYYFYTFPIKFLPWVLFLPAAVYHGFSEEIIEERRKIFFLLVWFVVIFLFFSLSKGKRSLYLLPVFPAVSIMVGKVWDGFTSSSADRWRDEWIFPPLYGLIGLILVAGSAMPWVVSMRFPAYLSYALPMAFLFVGIGLAMFIFYRFKNYGGILLLVIGMVAGGFFYALRVVFPQINSYKSARFISQVLTSTIQPGEKLATFRLEPAPYNYYTGIIPILELEEEKALVRFLQSRERVFCLIKSRDLDGIQTKEALPIVELAVRQQMGHRDVVLISNR